MKTFIAFLILITASAASAECEHLPHQPFTAMPETERMVTLFARDITGETMFGITYRVSRQDTVEILGAHPRIEVLLEARKRGMCDAAADVLITPAPGPDRFRAIPRFTPADH